MKRWFSVFLVIVSLSIFNVSVAQSDRQAKQAECKRTQQSEQGWVKKCLSQCKNPNEICMAPGQVGCDRKRTGNIQGCVDWCCEAL